MPWLKRYDGETKRERIQRRMLGLPAPVSLPSPHDAVKAAMRVLKAKRPVNP
jgi:hypothetical protein